MYAAGVHSCKSRSGAGRRAARAGGRHDISDGQRRRPLAISGNPNITPPSWDLHCIYCSYFIILLNSSTDFALTLQILIVRIPFYVSGSADSVYSVRAGHRDPNRRAEFLWGKGMLISMFQRWVFIWTLSDCVQLLFSTWAICLFRTRFIARFTQLRDKLKEDLRACISERVCLDSKMDRIQKEVEYGGAFAHVHALSTSAQ